MRVLVTSAPNQGHLYPMLPLLWSLRNAGHDIVIAGPDTFADTAARMGLPAVSIGADVVIGEVGSHGDGPALQDSDTGALVTHVIDYYVPLAERFTARIVEIADSWRPDLVIHSNWEYAGPIAAARLGVPAVLHGWGLNPPRELDAPVAAALSDLHHTWGLPDGPPPPWRTVDVAPAGLQSGPERPGVLPLASVPYNGSSILPDWLLKPADGTRILVTLGNIPIMGEHEGVLATTLDALRQLDVDIVVAAGGRLAQDAVLPARTRVLRGLPLSAIVPGCDLVIHHGGAGSALATLAGGLPALVLPQMCVQYQHADRIAEIGAGSRLYPKETTAAAVLEEVTHLLGSGEVRAVAGRLQAEMTERPPAYAVAQTIEAALAQAVS